MVNSTFSFELVFTLFLLLDVNIWQKNQMFNSKLFRLLPDKLHKNRTLHYVNCLKVNAIALVDVYQHTFGYYEIKSPISS